MNTDLLAVVIALILIFIIMVLNARYIIGDSKNITKSYSEEVEGCIIKSTGRELLNKI